MTFTSDDLWELEYQASLLGDHALASLIGTFADRPGPGTDYIIRTAIEGEYHIKGEGL